jgi:hypothetical protein
MLQSITKVLMNKMKKTKIDESVILTLTLKQRIRGDELMTMTRRDATPRVMAGGRSVLRQKKLCAHASSGMPSPVDTNAFLADCL